MTPERWARIEQLFHSALERAPADRERWLTSACEGDESLRQEVASLLAQRGSLFERGVGNLATHLVAATPGAHEGTAFGPYVVGTLVGAGGMGEVYRAHDSRLNRDVALKVVAGAMAADAPGTGRFEREARALAALNHPHVAAIYGLEQREGTIAIVMELVEGRTLDETLANGPLTLQDTLRFGAQIADALAAAHKKQIVHRDLKPANIKIAPSGVLKVLDFGLAKAAADTDAVNATVTETSEGVILGTAPYMSPEQARGRPVDSRTDVWSFGCVLYEMATGRRAFFGDSVVDVLAAVVHREPDFSILPATTPRRLRALLQLCLRKDAADRPADLATVRDELLRLAARRPRRQLAVGAAIVLTAIATAVVVRYAWSRGSLTDAIGDAVRSARSAAPHDFATFAALKPAQMTSSKGFDGFVDFAPDGKAMAYSSDISGSMEIYVQALAPGSSPQQLTNNGRQNVQPSWSPDGQVIAYSEMSGGGIWIVPSRGGAARKVSDFGSHARWSPDGRRLVFQSWPVTELGYLGAPEGLSTLWTVDASGSEAPSSLTVSGSPPGSHRAPEWFYGSDRVLFAVGNRLEIALWVVDVGDKRARQVAANPKFTDVFALTPQTRGVYFKARDAHSIWYLPLDRFDDPAAKPVPTGLPLTGSSIQQLAVAADGSRIGWTTFEQTANIWSVPLSTDRESDGAAASVTDGSGIRFGMPAVAHDGRVAMVGMRPGSPLGVFVLEPRAQLRQVTSHSPMHGAPIWRPGERDLALVTDHGSGPGLWRLDPETGQEQLLFLFSALPRAPGVGPPNLVNAAISTAFSPDFKSLALAASRDGVPNVWVAALGDSGPTGQLVQRTFERTGGTYPSWSPDARWIAYQCADGSNTQLCVIGADGSARVQLSDGPGQSWTGGWSPDSKQILIAARRDAVWNVAVISRTTGAMRMLTHFSEPRIYVRYPRWDQHNNRVLFERSDSIGKIWSVEVPRRDP